MMRHGAGPAPDSVTPRGDHARSQRSPMVGYRPQLAPLVGGAVPALLLSQLLYWTGKQWDPAGWICKDQQALQQETGLTRREQETARKRLRQAGVLEETRRAYHRKLHYRVNGSALGRARAAPERRPRAYTAGTSVGAHALPASADALGRPEPRRRGTPPDLRQTARNRRYGSRHIGHASSTGRGQTLQGFRY